MPVVQTDGRSVYGHVITKFSRMGRLLHFLSYGAPPTPRRFAPRLELRYQGKHHLDAQILFIDVSTIGHWSME